jgi:hypothetical protein
MGLFGPKYQMEINESLMPLVAKNEIKANRLPQLNTDKIFLKQGEYCSYIDKAILNIHVKKRITQRVGHSFPGLFKGTRMATGISKPIEYEEMKQQKGILYITNKRVIFQAQQNAFDKQHRYLSSIKPYGNAVLLQYGEKIYELIVPDGSIVYYVLKLINK